MNVYCNLHFPQEEFVERPKDEALVIFNTFINLTKGCMTASEINNVSDLEKVI
jgi:hypothetical protein